MYGPNTPETTQSQACQGPPFAVRCPQFRLEQKNKTSAQPITTTQFIRHLLVQSKHPQTRYSNGTKSAAPTARGAFPRKPASSSIYLPDPATGPRHRPPRPLTGTSLLLRLPFVQDIPAPAPTLAGQLRLAALPRPSSPAHRAHPARSTGASGSSALCLRPKSRKRSDDATLCSDAHIPLSENSTTQSPDPHHLLVPTLARSQHRCW